MTPVMASLAELIRSTEKYKDNYEWFVELAKNFHWIQTKMVEPSDKVAFINDDALVAFSFDAGKIRNIKCKYTELSTRFFRTF